MPKTQSRYQQDLGFTDGKIFCGPGDVFTTGGTAPTNTSNAPGFSLNQGASLTNHYGTNLTNQILRRLGFFEDLQEQFGGGGIPASAQPQFYRPDVESTYGVQMSKAQQIQPRTAFKTKGFRLISFDAIYGISGAALTTSSVRVDQIQYQNNLAPVNTVVIAAGANGLATATQAQPYVTTITPTFQPYFILNDSVLWIDWTVTTQAGGAFVFYGFDIAVEFNFN
jgi:hypothetical protein